MDLGANGFQTFRHILLPNLATAMLAGVTAFWLYHLWDGKFGHGTLPTKIGAVFVPGAVAGGVYWLLAVLARIPSATEMGGLITKRLRGGRRG